MLLNITRILNKRIVKNKIIINHYISELKNFRNFFSGSIFLYRTKKLQGDWLPGKFRGRVENVKNSNRERERKVNNLTNRTTLIWKTHIVSSRYRTYRFLCRQKSGSRFQRTSRNRGIRPRIQ